MKLNLPSGSFIVVVVISKFLTLSIIFTTRNSKDRPTIDGKIQPNAGLTFKLNFDALNSNIECVNAFAVSSAEVTNPTPYWAQ